MKTFQVVAGLILVIALLFGLGVGVRWANVQVNRWLSPQEENVRREVFEETKAYNEAKEQELAKLYKEYLSADGDAKKGIEAYVTHSFADYPIDRLDVSLQDFVRECRGY